MAAFSLDALVVAAVGAGGWFLTRSVGFAGLLMAEAAAGLSIMEARTGLTIGNAVLKQRTAQADRPWSPGIGRQFARSMVLGLGALVGGVGAWVVVASSGWDGSGQRRSWADRVGGTVVVKVPARAGQQGSVPAVAPGLGTTTPTPPIMTPRAVSTLPPGVVSPPPEPQAAPPAPLPTTGPQPLVGLPSDTGTDVAVLVVFDTGQREQLPLGTSAVLGRGPVPTVPSDQTIIVHDTEGTVSKSHLRIEHARDAVWVTDLGSTNGTDLVDDDGHTSRLVAGTRVRLDEGTRVRIGHRVFTVSRVVRGGER